MDDLITSRGMRLPAFKIVHQGQVLDPGLYTTRASLGHGEVDDLIDPERVIRLFTEGATIILRGLHRYHAGISAWCDAFATELGHPVRANAYVTPSNSQGFDAHYDNHDVFVLQCSGTKRWVVFGPRHPYPLSDDEADQYVQPSELGAEVIDEVIQPGDTLYIPRGWPHYAATDKTTSIHLTIGVLVFTWLDVFALMLTKARSVSTLRSTIPTPVDSDAFKEGLQAASATFAALMNSADSAELAEAMDGTIKSHQKVLAPGSWLRRASQGN